MRPAHRFLLSLALLVSAAWAGLSLWTGFPYFYHTDEPAKARQVIDGSRNFHHPLLMLDSAAAAATARSSRATSNPPRPESKMPIGCSLRFAIPVPLAPIARTVHGFTPPKPSSKTPPNKSTAAK